MTAFAPYWGEANPKNWSVRCQPDRTVELRMDVVQFQQDDAFAILGVRTGDDSGEVCGYSVLLDRNEIALLKLGWGKEEPFISCFFWERLSNLPEDGLSLSVAYSLANGDLAIHVRVLDRWEQNVLWQKVAMDTRGLDPVLPDRSVKNLRMQAEGIAAPYSRIDLLPVVGILWCNTINAPAQPPEVIIDNVQLLDRFAPRLEIATTTGSIALSWQTPLEEHILMVADQLSGPWRPCPQLVTLSSDTLCVSMPCLGPQKFFKLVPGTRVTQDFNGSQPPWHPHYWDYGNAGLFTWTIKDGALRIECPDSVGGGDILLLPSRSDIVVSDFSASVDILDWGSGINSRSVGIFARGVVDRDNFPGQTEGYIGELWINRNNSVGLASLNIFADGDQPTEEVAEFELEAGNGYRLQFSGIANQLTLRLFKLSDLERPVAESQRIANSWSDGPVGLWIHNRDNQAYDFTVDNIVVIGTKAVR